jgi:integrase/recombinase XerD
VLDKIRPLLGDVRWRAQDLTGRPVYLLALHLYSSWGANAVVVLVLIKTLLYTGVRVSELVAIRLTDVDFDPCQVRINEGKGRKDRVVPFPSAFKETLPLQHDRLRQRWASFLFESS